MGVASILSSGCETYAQNQIRPLLTSKPHSLILNPAFADLGPASLKSSIWPRKLEALSTGAAASLGSEVDWAILSSVAA